jgi:hypothetical protein
MSAAPSALAPSEVARLLESAGTMIGAEFAAMTEAALVWHPAPGEWCAKEVIGHLIESERRGFAGRIRIILAGADPALETWDQDGVARSRRDCERAAGTLVEEFRTMRRDSVALVAGLRAADLGRGGRHPKVGPLRVADLLHEWVHHDRNHLRQLLANLQSFAWPNMGNAQRFSAPQ